MKEIIIEKPNQESLDQLFGVDESIGLYFERSWRHGLKVKALKEKPSYVCYGVNEGTTKKCQLFKGGEVIDFDGFQPKNNLKYYLYAKGEEQIVYYNSNEKLSYSVLREKAEALASEGKEVLISEEFCKLRRIEYKEKVPFHPFEQSIKGKDIFFLHSRTKTFSNLITNDEQKALGMEDLESWQTMGYSNLSMFKRLSHFCLGELKKYSAPSEEHSFSTISKNGESESFKTYVEAIEFCKKQNKKGEIGCEFIICENLQSMSWH
jgi:hypothetical protein